MLNFRKLRQDFSSSILKEGKELSDKKMVLSAKILDFDGNSIKLSSRVKGTFENIYECELEIDRNESTATDSNCDCPYNYDCHHISAVLFYLEHHLDEILAAYSQEADFEENEQIDENEKQQLKETLEKAVTKEESRRDIKYQKEILQEYVIAAEVLGTSPYFLAPEQLNVDRAELALIFNNQSPQIIDHRNLPEIQIALRLPYRSKPLYIPNVKVFLESVRYNEPIILGGKRYFFTVASFEGVAKSLIAMLMDYARFYTPQDEKYLRVAQLEPEALGTLFAATYNDSLEKGSLKSSYTKEGERESPAMPCMYCTTLEEPLYFSNFLAQIHIKIESVNIPGPTLLLKPMIIVEGEVVSPKDVWLFESAQPGLVYKNTYYRFQSDIKRVHLRHLATLRDLSIPEPLFGSFIENSLPILQQYAVVANPEILDNFVTLPYVSSLTARAVIHYLDGELEAKIFFLYDNKEIPGALTELQYPDISLFVTAQGILARNLVEERQIIDEIFQDFLFDPKESVFRVKSEKKIVEFMTEIVPRFQHRIKFECPENLSDQFIYDESSFELKFKESEKIDSFDVELKVNGYLKGVSIDLLWECLAAKKTFVELETASSKGKKGRSTTNRLPRILVLDLEKISPLVHLFDEIGIKKLDDHTEMRPLWSLASVHESQFDNLPVKFSMTKKLGEIQKQILGESALEAREIPKDIQASLRKYQIEGVQWLERLRNMHLNGILADDMGLGKTLQAITAITQSKKDNPESLSIIVCPTSLVYNWKEEFTKFNSKLKVLVVDSVPAQRKKLLKEVSNYDIVITSYNLLQKDIEIYNKLNFSYVILDEAQHIKNRGTRNARSVKMIQGAHRLILTGTPIENSLDELWSLFDFLMPGLLSSYDRFVEKYIRNFGNQNIENLKRKVSPFILRRMKVDVLDDLPPVSEIVYHCHLSDTQKELYQSYAASAKEELSRLVNKEGFDKVQIHVLATLTRLKQICCHPAIFAKEKAEEGDSAKYDLLMDLLPSLIEGKHKTVIFSQYTRMLSIMRDDLEKSNIRFAYLDGSSKNRLSIVNQFNEDPNISVFLVSLKAGGSGLNLVGADTVIHYDMWWNPAVENQATDRVHRLGQKRNVSSYKLITLDTIEEKILNLQNRKKGLVKKVVSCDDEAISKLTWEEVLELLQTNP